MNYTLKKIFGKNNKMLLTFSSKSTIKGLKILLKIYIIFYINAKNYKISKITLALSGVLVYYYSVLLIKKVRGS